MIETPKKKRVKKEATPEETAAALARSEAWKTYSIAYEKRYGNKPIRSAKENTQIKNIVSSVGQQDAPFLIEFYLSCTDEFLVGRCHPLGLLASNPNEYVTRMKRGQTHRGHAGGRYGSSRPDARRLGIGLSNPHEVSWAVIPEDDETSSEAKTNAQ